eukprot:CAMPEP_0195069534 /NCGR_PEP_ID=MMETSP0448-20130528/13817_1 /TAXON_ID=66468 /ORGANISM="Heterocapsa triquestra, Strain CCMP 448" /LENGTH=42 /DNA_ID= /DNA_START= /DNA_END= /DNA_ORIENTATION=
MGVPTVAPQQAAAPRTTKKAATCHAIPASATKAITSDEWDLI